MAEAMEGLIVTRQDRGGRWHWGFQPVVQPDEEDLADPGGCCDRLLASQPCPGYGTRREAAEAGRGYRDGLR